MKTKTEIPTQFEANLNLASENNSITSKCKSEEPFIEGRKMEKFSPLYRQVIQSHLIIRLSISQIAYGKFPQTVNNIIQILINMLLLVRRVMTISP